MQIVIELDSFWVGFVAGVFAFFLIGLLMGARMKRKQTVLEKSSAVSKNVTMTPRKR